MQLIEPYLLFMPDISLEFNDLERFDGSIVDRRAIG